MGAFRRAMGGAQAMVVRNRWKNLFMAVWMMAAGFAWPDPAAARIWAEAEISDTLPYVQQSVIYTVRVFSENNLSTADVYLPQVPSASFIKLDGPIASARYIGRDRYIVNEYRYAFISMSPGKMHLPATRLEVRQVSGQPGRTGTYNPWSAAPAAAAPRKPLTKVWTKAIEMEVMPPPEDVRSWLPVRLLRIDGNLQSPDQVRVGDPITLTVTLAAWGATGDQLPSVEAQLRGHDFKVYPERPHTEWHFDHRASNINGRRVETFTLVPTRAGEIELPQIQVPWWDVANARENTAWLPSRVIKVEGAAAGSRSPVATASPRRASGGPHAAPERGGVSLRVSEKDVTGFWLPVFGGLLLAFVLGLWIGKGRPGSEQASRLAVEGARQLAPVMGHAGRHAVRGMGTAVGLLQRVLPRRYSVPLGRLRDGLAQRLGRLMPVRLRMWGCMRCVRKASDPEGLCLLVRRFACDALNLPANVPLRRIADALARRGPRRDDGAIHDLLKELDDAVYGSGDLDVAAWKRRFRRLFRRLIFSSRQWVDRVRGEGLPELNPR